MDTIDCVNGTKTKSLGRIRVDVLQQPATPKERLRTVEEFVDELEKAVLERL